MSNQPESDRRLPADPPEHNNLSAILWILFSVLASSAMAIGVRDVSSQLDSRMIVFGRALVSTGILMGVVMASGRLRGVLRFSRPGQHLARGLAIAGSTHLGFYAIANLPLAQVTVLFFTAPIWATVMAVLVHKETVGPRRVGATALGFAGALIVLRPGFSGFQPAMIAALGSSVLFALALTMSRGLARADGALSAYFSSVVITTLASLPFVLPVLAVPDDPRGWIAAMVVVLGGMIRGYADIEAYRLGEAAILAPITYLRLAFIATAAYFIYNEIPDIPTLLGFTVIVTASIYITRREALATRHP